MPARKFLARALRDPWSMAAHIRCIEQFGERYQLGAAHASVLEKPLRPYARQGLSMKQRAALIAAHCEIVATVLPSSFAQTVWQGSEVELGMLEGRSGAQYRILLGPARQAPKEGELSLVLTRDEDGLPLSCLTFMFETGAASSATLFIGGLQGPNAEHAKRAVIAATRDLWGMRPKMITFLAACVLADVIGAGAIIAASNATHILAAPRDGRRAAFQADYDRFWIEREGAPVDRGFEIPIVLGPRADREARNACRQRVVDLLRSAFDPHPCRGAVPPTGGSSDWMEGLLQGDVGAGERPSGHCQDDMKAVRCDLALS